MVKRAAAESSSSSAQPARKKQRVSAPAKVKRLGIPRPAQPAANEARAINLRGSRASKSMGSGGFAASTGQEPSETLWVTRKTGFVAYLKRGTTAVEKRGATRVSFSALGAAIPMAMRLGLSLRDAVPGEGWEVQVKTGSLTVTDEIEPEDAEEDLSYRQRTKSSIEVVVCRLL